MLVRVRWGHRTYGLSLYIEVIYCEDLQSVVQITQQWSAVNREAKNLVVSQSHEAGCLSRSSAEVAAKRCAGE